MTTKLAETRKKTALRWAIGAGVALAIAAIAIAIQTRSFSGDRSAGPAIAGLAEQVREAQKITVRTKDSAYRITRSQRGWTMTDRGNFPVREDRLRQFTDGLVRLEKVRRMTDDPERHEQLGVGDPAKGGNGVLVSIENPAGAFIANVIIGVMPNGVFMRAPDDNQVWEVKGDLPPLHEPAAWLDLKPLDQAPQEIVRVEITPREGAPYIIERNAQNRFAFAGANAARQPISSETLTAVAGKLANLEPVDVLPASAVQGQPNARLSVRLDEGVIIDAQFVPFDGKTWLRLAARAENPQAQATTNAINERAAAWAYALANSDVEQTVPPLSALLPPAPSGN